MSNLWYFQYKGGGVWPFDIVNFEEKNKVFKMDLTIEKHHQSFLYVERGADERKLVKK